MDIISEVLTFARDYVNGNQTEERKQKIAAAYFQCFGERMRIGCKTCYIESIFLIKRKMESKHCRYRLKPGALLQAFGDASKTCTNHNLTDELAEYHLRTNPGVAHLFSIIPPRLEPAKELEIVPAEPIKNEPIKEPESAKEVVFERPKRTRKAK